MALPILPADLFFIPIFESTFYFLIQYATRATRLFLTGKTKQTYVEFIFIQYYRNCIIDQAECSCLRCILPGKCCRKFPSRFPRAVGFFVAYLNSSIMGSNNFKDLSRRMTLYLDGELNTEQERELLQEIQQNPQYVQLLSKEQHFREFIKSRLQRKSVSPTLVQSIKDKIRTSI